jgi:hypothetical protein
MIVLKSKWGWGNTHASQSCSAATMIVAAGLIGITQARLPRPVRGYHDRIAVEMSAIALHDTIANSLAARPDAHFHRQMLRS